MEVLAWLVFFACFTVTGVGVSLALFGVIEAARKGNQSAQLMLASIALMALALGFGWSIDFLWGAP